MHGAAFWIVCRYLHSALLSSNACTFNAMQPVATMFRMACFTDAQGLVQNYIIVSLQIVSGAVETKNVVATCFGNEAMKNMLPHLLEQLELCQKSLSAYLETKRAEFPVSNSDAAPTRRGDCASLACSTVELLKSCMQPAVSLFDAPSSRLSPSAIQGLVQLLLHITILSSTAC